MATCKKAITVDEKLELTVDKIPRCRLATPEEQAVSSAFLASEMSGYISGISLIVDGGETKAM